MNAHAVEGELLGAEPVAKSSTLSVRLSDGSEARVGATVYITPAGAKKIIDEMFRAMGVRDLDGAITAMVKMAPATDQAKVKETFHRKMRSVGTLPFTVSAIVAADKVDLRSSDREVSDLPGVPTNLLVGKPQPGSALDFLKYQYGPLPLWGWGLVGVGTIGAGILVVRALRK